MSDSTVELLQKHFDLAIEAPDGIAKLRELILTLAMQGKLVPQDPNDPPASELLKEIEAEKRRLARLGIIKKPKELDPVLESDTFFGIPSTWAWTRLGEVMTKITDGTHHSPPNLERGDFLYISAKNIKADGVLLSNATYVTREIHEEIFSRCNPEFGDLLYIKDGATTGIATINNLVEPFSMLSSVALLKPSSGVYNSFLLQVLRSPFFYQEMRSEMTGVAITRVTLQKLEEAMVPLPPLPEQRRIVAKIDQLMAVCDDLEKKRDALAQKRLAFHNAAIRRLLEAEESSEFSSAWDFLVEHFGEVYSVKENVAELRKAILQLAVMGKLVKQDSNDPPASELLKEIEAEKRRLVKEGKIKAPKPLPPIAPEEVPFAAPKGWEWVRLESLFITSGGIQKTPSRAPRDNAFPYIGVSNVLRGRIDLTKIERFELLPGELEKKRLETGDLLVIEGNGSLSEIGRCALWEGAIENCVHQNHIIRCRPQKKEVGRFVLLEMNSPFGVSEMQQLAITTSGLYNLSVGKIQQFVLALPPLAEQHRIVAKVDQLMALCDRLEAQIDTTTAKKTAILNAVLAKAT